MMLRSNRARTTGPAPSSIKLFTAIASKATAESTVWKECVARTLVSLTEHAQETATSLFANAKKDILEIAARLHHATGTAVKMEGFAIYQICRKRDIPANVPAGSENSAKSTLVRKVLTRVAMEANAFKRQKVTNAFVQARAPSKSRGSTAKSRRATQRSSRSSHASILENARLKMVLLSAIVLTDFMGNSASSLRALTIAARMTGSAL